MQIAGEALVLGLTWACNWCQLTSGQGHAGPGERTLKRHRALSGPETAPAPIALAPGVG